MTEKEKDWWKCLGGLDYLEKYGGYATVEEDYPYTLDQIGKWKVEKEKEIRTKITIEDITIDSYSNTQVKIKYSYWRDGENA